MPDTPLNQQKRSKWNAYSKTVDTSGNNILVPMDTSRVALVIGVGSGGSALLGKNVGLTASNALTILGTVNPFQLSLAEHGAIVHGPIFAAGIVGSADMVVWEAHNSEL